jgi:hypothetical protein
MTIAFTCEFKSRKRYYSLYTNWRIKDSKVTVDIRVREIHVLNRTSIWETDSLIDSRQCDKRSGVTDERQFSKL